MGGVQVLPRAAPARTHLKEGRRRDEQTFGLITGAVAITTHSPYPLTGSSLGSYHCNGFNSKFV